MIDPLLKMRLAPIVRRQRRLQLAAKLAICWALAAILGLGLIFLQRQNGWSSPVWIFLCAMLGVGGAITVIVRHSRSETDWRKIAQRIEARFPELNGLLLTAIQQERGESGELNYLQEWIVVDAFHHSQSNRWTEVISWRRAAIAQLANLLALVLFVAVLSGLRIKGGGAGSIFSGGWTGDGVTVLPGDTSIERGSSLVVLTRFGGSMPANVELVVGETQEQSRHIPLAKSLADPVFGGSVPEVASNLVYHVEYSGKRTREFKVAVFDYPRLERADADVTYPDYTGLAPKRIENTRRLSAVEGSRLDLTLQLNKPVVSAQFIANGEATNIITLVVETNRAIATLKGLPFETNKIWQLQLVDADGRTNKAPALFVMDVLKNREPELKLASPRGDVRPSSLEELSFEGTVWDDFGVKAYGLAYTVAGQETKFVELGGAAPGKEKHPFKYVLRLEDLGASPDEFISWFLWADDIGPDGQVRRSAGDLFFAEVRPFDEIFREGQGQAGGQSGGGQRNQASELAELQKQIISATWRLQREHRSQLSRSKDGAKPPTSSNKPSKDLSNIKLAHPHTSPIFSLYSLKGGEGRVEEANYSQAQISSPQPSPPSGGKREIGSVSKCAPIKLSDEHGVETFRSVVVQNVFGQRAGRESDAEPPVVSARDRLQKISSTNRTDSASRYVEDLNVVRDALSQALEQAETARDRQSDLRNAGLWDDVIHEMEKAQEQLDKAASSPSSLPEALAAEQAAYQALLKLQQREYEVARNRNQSQGGGNSREQQMRQQLDQLDLTQSENRYETERQAQAPQSPERQEQLQVMNRLKELARRQQDLNDRLKEMQTALQEARTEQEREEIRRRLKRLQEEEQQMLADVDELKQRMDKPENQSRMNEQRQQLDQTRQEIQRAAESVGQGSPSQALASGTRAQRQLQQMREDMRKQNSSEFAEDMRQMRAEAREISREQADLQKKLESLNSPQNRTLDDSQLLDQLAQQKQRLTNLLEHATRVSQEAEQAEPLVSRELYDTLRQFSQNDAGNVKQLQDELIQRRIMSEPLYERLKEIQDKDRAKSLELTSELLRQGLGNAAGAAGNLARAETEDLRKGVERAADKVLGDDTEALRLAQQQLDQLTGQLEREIAQAQNTAATNNQTGANGLQSQQSENRQQQSGQRAQGNAGGKQGQPQEGNEPNQQASGTGQGQQPSQRAASVQSEQQQPGGSQAGNAQGAQAGANPQERSGESGQGGRGNRQLGGAAQGGGGDGGSVLPSGLDRFLQGQDGGGVGTGPVITGGNFAPWSDRLREVEEMVDDPSLQNQLATARERARLMRQEYRRDLKKPDWAVVRLQVMKPLVEVRDQIAEELARRGPRDNLVPIDRDPVPNRYSELVRRYYEELGKDK